MLFGLFGGYKDTAAVENAGAADAPATRGTHLPTPSKSKTYGSTKPPPQARRYKKNSKVQWDDEAVQVFEDDKDYTEERLEATWPPGLNRDLALHELQPKHSPSPDHTTMDAVAFQRVKYDLENAKINKERHESTREGIWEESTGILFDDALDKLNEEWNVIWRKHGVLDVEEYNKLLDLAAKKPGEYNIQERNGEQVLVSRDGKIVLNADNYLSKLTNRFVKFIEDTGSKCLSGRNDSFDQVASKEFRLRNARDFCRKIGPVLKEHQGRIDKGKRAVLSSETSSAVINRALFPPQEQPTASGCPSPVSNVSLSKNASLGKENSATLIPEMPVLSSAGSTRAPPMTPFEERMAGFRELELEQQARRDRQEQKFQETLGNSIKHLVSQKGQDQQLITDLVAQRGQDQQLIMDLVAQKGQDQRLITNLVATKSCLASANGFEPQTASNQAPPPTKQQPAAHHRLSPRPPGSGCARTRTLSAARKQIEVKITDEGSDHYGKKGTCKEGSTWILLDGHEKRKQFKREQFEKIPENSSDGEAAFAV